MKLFNLAFTDDANRFYNWTQSRADRNKHMVYVDMMQRFPQSLFVCKDLTLTDEVLDGLWASEDLVLPAGTVIYWYLTENIMLSDYYRVMLISPEPKKKITIMAMRNLRALYKAYMMCDLCHFEQKNLWNKVLNDTYEITYIDSPFMCTNDSKKYPFAAAMRLMDGTDFIAEGATPIDAVRAGVENGASISKSLDSNGDLRVRLKSVYTTKEPDLPYIMAAPNPRQNTVAMQQIVKFDDVFDINNYAANTSGDDADNTTQVLYKDYWYTAPGIRIRHTTNAQYVDDKLYLDQYVFDPVKDLNSTYFVDKNEAMKHF